MTRILAILHRHRAGLMALARQYGVENVRVFGSVARGDDRPDNDIDLLVAMEKGRDLFDFIGFKLDAEEALGKKVDLVSEAGMHRLLAPCILADARPL